MILERGGDAAHHHADPRALGEAPAIDHEVRGEGAPTAEGDRPRLSEHAGEPLEAGESTADVDARRDRPEHPEPGDRCEARPLDAHVDPPVDRRKHEQAAVSVLRADELDRGREDRELLRRPEVEPTFEGDRACQRMFTDRDRAEVLTHDVLELHVPDPRGVDRTGGERLLAELEPELQALGGRPGHPEGLPPEVEDRDRAPGELRVQRPLQHAVMAAELEAVDRDPPRDDRPGPAQVEREVRLRVVDPAQEHAGVEQEVDRHEIDPGDSGDPEEDAPEIPAGPRRRGEPIGQRCNLPVANRMTSTSRIKPAGDHPAYP